MTTIIYPYSINRILIVIVYTNIKIKKLKELKKMKKKEMDPFSFIILNF